MCLRFLTKETLPPLMLLPPSPDPLLLITEPAVVVTATASVLAVGAIVGAGVAIGEICNGSAPNDANIELAYWGRAGDTGFKKGGMAAARAFAAVSISDCNTEDAI